MKLDEVTKINVKRIKTKELGNLHYRCHQLFSQTNKINNQELIRKLREKHIILVTEMNKKKIAHNTPL